jgi:hypothetical protein
MSGVGTATCTPGEPGRRSRSGLARLPDAQEPLTLFCQHLPHALDLQALLTNNLQETVVFAFQTSKPFSFGDAGVPITLLPEVERRGAASEVTTQL